jgi:tetratricopeptide (TPR) repeat protein
MESPSDPAILGDQGKRDFAAGDYATALDKFRRAADGYAALDDPANQAEQMNNVGVTLLQLARAQEAFDAVTGTEVVFAAQGDLKRQAIAMNNQAAALEALHRSEEAVTTYDKAAKLLGEAGEAGLQSEALKAAAAVDLRRGRVSSSGSSMLGAMISNPNPNLLERMLRALLRRI